jgi:DNA polymerase III subunit alpha
MSYQLNQQSKICMIFDTETTGLPMKRIGEKFTSAKDLKLYDSCRLVQFSAIIFDFDSKETLEEINFIIKPKSFTITNSHIHGITQNKALANGIKVTTLFEKLIEIFKKYQVVKLIGHNVTFDINVMISEMFRYMKVNTLVNFPLLKQFEKIPYFCSMKNTVNICKLPNKNYPDKFKYPKLSELYKYIFNKEATNLHNSMNDTIYTLECVVELYDFELIKLF